MTLTVGFIGLGNIGFPMAKNIVECADFNSIVFDVFDEPKQQLAALGAEPAATATDVAKTAQIIGLCVRDNNDVEQLLYGDQGLFANAAADTIIAIHSTVTQEAMLKWAKDGAEHKIHVVDAPITGGAQGAAEKTLCYMVGGSEDVLARLEPVLNTSAKKIVHAGVVGQGIVLKLCNNLINYAAFTAIDEAGRLAESAGLSTELVYQVGEVNGIVTEMMKRFHANRDVFKPACSEEDFKGIFAPFAKLAEKDLDAALECAQANQITLPATSTVREVITGVFFKEN